MPEKPLPDFASPPIVEVALGVQFDDIELTPVHLGLFALAMRALGYVGFEQHPPLNPVIEDFGGSGGRRAADVRFRSGPPNVRVWLASEDKNTVLQLQSDRFIHNWRKVQVGDEYPRYEAIRETFRDRFARFVDFVADAGLGTVHCKQCEVAYVNHVRQADGWDDASQLGQVVRIASSAYSETFLPSPENTRAVAHYVIGGKESPIGRLHVNCHTALDVEGNEPIVVINLTARGIPSGPDCAGALSFMDVGREWIVRGFADITTEQMHRTWDRRV